MKTTAKLSLLALVMSLTPAVHADIFGSGDSEFRLIFDGVNLPGFPADDTGNPNPAGYVDHGFYIGQHEVHEDAIDKANAAGGLGITKDSRGPNKPTTSIDWFEAARFVNWLNANAIYPFSPTPPAYKFDDAGNFQLWQPGDDGYDPNNPYRNSRARYFLPNIDEWYKAAYWGGDIYFDYPGSMTAPTPVAGVPPHQFETIGKAVYDQPLAAGPADITHAGLGGGWGPKYGLGGNVWEWQETSFDLANDSPTTPRSFRGGAWDSDATSLLSTTRLSGEPTLAQYNLGFRVARVPEPGSSVLAATTLAGILALYRRIERAAAATGTSLQS